MEEAKTELSAREAAERFRRKIQADAINGGFALPSRDQVIKWCEDNNPRLEAMARSSGAREKDIDRVVSGFKQILADARLENEFDEPFTRTILRELINICEAALPAIGFRDSVKASFGVTFANGPIARGGPFAEIPVVMVHQPFFAFCNTLSKLLTALFPFKETKEGIRLTIGADSLMQQLRTDSVNLFLFLGFVAQYAAIGREIRPTIQLQNPRAAGIRFELLQGMELFGVAHELGHSLVAAEPNGVDDIPAAHREEYAADLVAAGVSFWNGIQRPSLFIGSGACGVLLLAFLGMVSRSHRILAGGTGEFESATHPDFRLRISQIDETAEELARELPENARAALRDVRQEMIRFTEVLWDELEPLIRDLHRAGIRPIRVDAEGEG